MSEQKLPPPLDPKAIANGLGTLQGERLVVGKTTVAYIKRHRIAVKAELVKGAPKNLVGTPKAESNGVWTNVECKDDAAARAVVEYVVEQAAAPAAEAKEAE